MTKKKTFKTIIERETKDGKLPKNIMESREWYRKKAKSARHIKGARPSRFLKIGRDNERLKRTIKGRLMMGRMYMFTYSPKEKDTLPYHDQFPVIFAIESHSDGILGINLHYLPHLFRAALMDKLYELRSDQELTEDTKLKMTYDILKRSTKYRYFRPCIKKYLNKQVTSRFMQIPPDEWEIALFLPLEKFKSNTGKLLSRQAVWIDSRKKIRKNRGVF